MPIPKVILPPDSAVYLKQGFDQMADLLAITLGPSQGHVVNESNTKERPELLNDAATIARRVIALPDWRQDVGAMMLRHLTFSRSHAAGRWQRHDGRPGKSQFYTRPLEW